MSSNPVERALAEARRVLLRLPGVVGVGSRGGAIVVYVESAEHAWIVPRRFMGVPVAVRVVGRLERL